MIEAAPQVPRTATVPHGLDPTCSLLEEVEVNQKIDVSYVASKLGPLELKIDHAQLQLCPESSAPYVRQPDSDLGAAINSKEPMPDKNNYNVSVDTNFSASDAGLEGTAAAQRRRKKQAQIKDHYLARCIHELSDFLDSVASVKDNIGSGVSGNNKGNNGEMSESNMGNNGGNESMMPEGTFDTDFCKIIVKSLKCSGSEI